MQASRSETTFSSILDAVKSKRYPRTRIQRLLLCAYLGISSQDLADKIPGAETVNDLRHAAKRLGELVQPGDLIFTMGAGDVFRITQYLE